MTILPLKVGEAIGLLNIQRVPWSWRKDRKETVELREEVTERRLRFPLHSRQG